MQLEGKFIRIAHDPGDPQITSHCPFCGSGQVTGRSDGTIDCAFCGMNYIVRVQPAFPGMPQQPMGPGALTDIGPEMGPMGGMGMDPMMGMEEGPPGEGMPPGMEGDEGAPPFGEEDEGPPFGDDSEGPPDDAEGDSDEGGSPFPPKDKGSKDKGSGSDKKPPKSKKKGSYDPEDLREDRHDDDHDDDDDWELEYEPPAERYGHEGSKGYRTLAGDHLDEARYIRHLAVLHSGGDPRVLAQLRREAGDDISRHEKAVKDHLADEHAYHPGSLFDYSKVEGDPVFRSMPEHMQPRHDPYLTQLDKTHRGAHDVVDEDGYYEANHPYEPPEVLAGGAFARWKHRHGAFVRVAHSPDSEADALHMREWHHTRESPENHALYHSYATNHTHAPDGSVVPGWHTPSGSSAGVANPIMPPTQWEGRTGALERPHQWLYPVPGSYEWQPSTGGLEHRAHARRCADCGLEGRAYPGPQGGLTWRYARSTDYKGSPEREHQDLSQCPGRMSKAAHEDRPFMPEPADHELEAHMRAHHAYPGYMTFGPLGEERREHDWRHDPTAGPEPRDRHQHALSENYVAERWPERGIPGTSWHSHDDAARPGRFERLNDHEQLGDWTPRAIDSRLSAREGT